MILDSLTVLIVAAAVFYTVRQFWLMLRKGLKPGQPGCGSCSGCDVKSRTPGVTIGQSFQFYSSDSKSDPAA